MIPVQVVTGAFHAYILVDEKDRGSVYCVGRNVDNQLDNDNNPDSNELVQVKGMYDTPLTNVKQIVAGCHHTCAIFQDDSAPLFCWGRNTENQLGFNKEALISIHVGGYTGHAVFSDNTVYAWGSNGYGTFGNGSKDFNTVIFGKDANVVKMNFDFESKAPTSNL